MATGLIAHLKSWWGKVTGFDRLWSRVLALLVVISALGLLFYAANKKALIERIMYVEFDDSTAASMAAFSIREVGIFVVVLVLSVFALSTAQAR